MNADQYEGEEDCGGYEDERKYGWKGRASPLIGILHSDPQSIRTWQSRVVETAGGEVI